MIHTQSLQLGILSCKSPRGVQSMFRRTSASALSNSHEVWMKSDAIISQVNHGAEVETTPRVQSGKSAGSIHNDGAFLRIYAASPRAEKLVHWETADQTLYFGVHYPKRLHCTCAPTEPANESMYDTCLAISWDTIVSNT